MGNIKKKEGNILIKISKNEMEFLQTKGYKFPEDLHRTYSGNKNNRYYATERKDLLKDLSCYRNSKIAK